MYENEIEWFTDELDSTEEIKKAIWDDTLFRELVEDRGLEASLVDVSHFHKTLTSQMGARGVTAPTGEWERKIISLAIRAKARRQQLRAAVRAAFEDGAEIVSRVKAEVEEDWSD